MKKRTGSKAKPKSLKSKGLTTKGAASVKGGTGGSGAGKVKFSELTIKKVSDS